MKNARKSDGLSAIVCNCWATLNLSFWPFFNRLQLGEPDFCTQGDRSVPRRATVVGGRQKHTLLSAPRPSDCQRRAGRTGIRGFGKPQVAGSKRWHSISGRCRVCQCPVVPALREPVQDQILRCRLRCRTGEGVIGASYFMAQQADMVLVTFPP